MISVLMGAVESGKGDKVLFSYWCHSFAAGHYYKTLWVFFFCQISITYPKTYLETYYKKSRKTTLRVLAC